ncbi:ElaA protein [Rhizocola hellebori]|uniref:ElaA protein n=1 Tax=Rhizocola hellebori TaxID=1392758 RepID=A0A8J3Q793_9ACTN|nr:GNAT family N-acetyltransferase [Rhizocola hellebori]GIH04667.1 ElaA protein [Rhizocola hellebori]
MIFHAAGFAELDTWTLYALLKLRTDVFVVEQRCAYPELDGRDAEPGTRHLWFESNRVPIAYLRLLSDVEEGAPVVRIGRVATVKEARGQGLAGKLLVAALAAAGNTTCVLDAQTEVAEFYGKYGFKQTGPEFVEDGIPHVPMRRDIGG